MIKKNILILAVAAAGLTTALAGCTKDFISTNTDPNRVDAITPGTLLNPIIYGMATYNMGQYRSITMDLMQVTAAYPNENVEDQTYLYDFKDGLGNGLWGTSYKWLANCKEMENAAIARKDANYRAVALTLKAWIYSNLTDAFGDVPMSDALKGDEGVVFTTFDKQQDIYKQIIDDLDTASAIYNDKVAMTYNADMLYGNDVKKWRKFTNSLECRLLLRTARKGNNWTKLAGILNDPVKYPVFENNADGANLQITGVAPNMSPWSRPQDYNTGRVFFDFFLGNLANWNDPRGTLLASNATDIKTNKSIGLKGLPINFLESKESINYNPSGMTQKPVIAPMIAPIMEYSELCFIKAEMMQRGYLAGSAETWYKAGIKSAIEQWMPSTYVFDAKYYDNAGVKYDGTLSKILLQKYYALFFIDYQQWFEYRRTGLPVLPKTSKMDNGSNMPTRFYYPQTVRVNNRVNYGKKIAEMGGDRIDIKCWWEQP